MPRKPIFVRTTSEESNQITSLRGGGSHSYGLCPASIFSLHPNFNNKVLPVETISKQKIERTVTGLCYNSKYKEVLFNEFKEVEIKHTVISASSYQEDADDKNSFLLVTDLSTVFSD